jgi:hypothetical protein
MTISRFSHPIHPHPGLGVFPYIMARLLTHKPNDGGYYPGWEDIQNMLCSKSISTSVSNCLSRAIGALATYWVPSGTPRGLIICWTLSRWPRPTGTSLGCRHTLPYRIWIGRLPCHWYLVNFVPPDVSVGFTSAPNCSVHRWFLAASRLWLGLPLCWSYRRPSMT